MAGRAPQQVARDRSSRSPADSGPRPMGGYPGGMGRLLILGPLRSVTPPPGPVARGPGALGRSEQTGLGRERPGRPRESDGIAERGTVRGSAIYGVGLRQERDPDD